MTFSFIDTHLYIELVCQRTETLKLHVLQSEIYGEKLIPRNSEKFGALDAVTL